METDRPPPDFRSMRRSTSQRRVFRQCGYAYLHRYVTRWKTVRNRGTYAFGDTMQAVADAIVKRQVTTPVDVESLFTQTWAIYEHDETRTWTDRASWTFLRDRGKALAQVMLAELPAIIPLDPDAKFNESLTFDLGGAPELAIPDYYGLVLDRSTAPMTTAVPTVLDWKSSDRDYKPIAAELDEQLTDYQLAQEAHGRPVAQVGLCVLVYSAKPHIQWLMAPARSQDEKDHFTVSAVKVDQLIRDEVFIRNDRACYTMGECAMLPLCYPSQRHRVATELIRTATVDEAAVTWEE
jgi:hypothetical protein